MNDIILDSLKIFVSSSQKGDLNNEREVAIKLIKKLSFIPVYFESAESTPFSPDTTYFRKIQSSDIVIVLLGELYTPHVENEFRYAVSERIDTLVFIKKCKREEELREKIKSLYFKVTYGEFTDTQELERKLKKSIICLVSQRFRSHKNIEKMINKAISDGDVNLPLTKIGEKEYLQDVYRYSPFER